MAVGAPIRALLSKLRVSPGPALLSEPAMAVSEVVVLFLGIGLGAAARGRPGGGAKLCGRFLSGMPGGGISPIVFPGGGRAGPGPVGIRAAGAAVLVYIF